MYFGAQFKVCRTEFEAFVEQTDSLAGKMEGALRKVVVLLGHQFTHNGNRIFHSKRLPQNPLEEAQQHDCHKFPVLQLRVEDGENLIHPNIIRLLSGIPEVTTRQNLWTKVMAILKCWQGTDAGTGFTGLWSHAATNSPL